MLPGVRDDARRTVAGLLIAIAGVTAGFAGVAGTSHPGWLITCIVIAAVATAVAVVVEFPDVKMLLDGRLRIPRLRRSRAVPPPAPSPPAPSPVILDTWQYTSDGQKARAAMMATEQGMPGTGSRLLSGNRPAWIRFVVLIPCSQIGPETEPGQLWAEFERFLKNQPVTSLVNSLTRPVSGVRWMRWAPGSAGNIQAVYTPGQEEEAMASARLMLPDGSLRFTASGTASAVLILHFEPPVGSRDAPLPAGPVAWTEHMMRALELPSALNRLLTHQFGLTTSGDLQVVLGFRLEAPSDLTEIIDITDLTKLPGGQHGRQAIGYFIADSAGARSAEVVKRMINHVLIYALQAEC
jgi:hypothetical protein